MNYQYKITLFNIYEGRTMNLFAEDMDGLYFLKDCAEEVLSVTEYKLFISGVLFDPKNKPEYDHTPYNKCVTKFSIIE